MKTIVFSILLVILLAACGNGQWGAELRLTVGGTDESGDAMTSGAVIDLPQGAWTLTVDRACLAVELAAITPAALQGTVSSDCFCHGDPPHCHGDCTTSADTNPNVLLSELDAVVDLLDGPTPFAPAGATPGAYENLSLVLGGDHAVDLPPACADMDGRTLWVQGTLTNTETAGTWALTVDLRTEVLTEPISAEPGATAATDSPALLLANLRLDLALAHVDFGAVTADATGSLTIGDDPGQNVDAANEILHDLSLAGSFTAQGLLEN